MQITPYLLFNGNCAEAIKTYEQVLGGTILAMMTHAEMPGGEHQPEENKALIMHACLKVGEGMLMASDCPPDMFEESKGMQVSLHPQTIEEAERIYAALSEGGQITMPLQETFWAPRFAMFTDRWGTRWMINCVPGQGCVDA